MLKMVSANIIDRAQDYMLSTTNLARLTNKHIIHNIRPTPSLEVTPTPIPTPMVTLKPPMVTLKPPMVTLKPPSVTLKPPSVTLRSEPKQTVKQLPIKQQTEKYYPKQKDSLFWCFYILKHGYFNYEMEINNNYFVVEKTEKFKYIELLRKNKDILKIHKIKPFTLLEDDLANKDKISIKTFFALCVLEKLNVLLVDKRKYIDLLCADVDDSNPIHVIHKNHQTTNHYIEVNASAEIINKYKQTYYKMDCLDSKLKSVGSYKLDELIELCNKLDININNQKKQTKGDIYNLLVLHY